MQKVYILENLGCANCASKMERSIEKIKGVNAVNINFMTKKLFLDTDMEDLDTILDEIRKKVNKIERQVVIREN